MTRIQLPVRYAAWLSGDLGTELERMLRHGLSGLDVTIERLPRGFLVTADEDAGPLLEALHRAALEMEDAVAARYPVFHHEMGPVWTGTLQAIFA